MSVSRPMSESPRPVLLAGVSVTRTRVAVVVSGVGAADVTTTADVADVAAAVVKGAADAVAAIVDVIPSVFADDVVVASSCVGSAALVVDAGGSVAGGTVGTSSVVEAGVVDDPDEVISDIVADAVVDGTDVLV